MNNDYIYVYKLMKDMHCMFCITGFFHSWVKPKSITKYAMQNLQMYVHDLK